jgi:ABC-2 type transport system permease protein
MYLYIKTFARTELFGIVARLTGVGVLAVVLLSGDWSKGTSYTLVLFFAGVQLSSLHQHHRYLVWTHIYPLQPSYRMKSLQKLVYGVHLVSAVVLFLPVALTGHSWAVMLFCALCGILLPYIYCNKYMVNKWLKDEENDH